MTKLQGLHIPSDYTDNIVLKGEDGCITLGMNAPLYWTELQSSPLYVPDVIESLYDANKCAFTLCYDTEDGTESKRHNVQYRNKWQNVWTDTPSFGEIFARAIDTNGNYVAPLRFINIGEGLVISLQKADKSSCQIKVSWAHGHVSTTEGEKKIGDVWEIKKENCNDPRKIRFTFLRKVFYSMGDGMRQTLSYSDIKDMDVFVPSMEEQQRIVTFFQSFDKQISLQTLQLEKLEQLKKACLKKMIA